MEKFEEERAKINFDRDELFRLICGEEEKYEFYTHVPKVFAIDPILKINRSFYDMPREKQMELNLKRTQRMLTLSKEKLDDEESKKLKSISTKFPEVSMKNIGLVADLSGSISSVALHYGMFETVIKYLGSDEQIKEYVDDILNLRILGCYSQTEFGHGSDVASLETTAVFDRNSDCFIINSPTITSGKCWPGELGKTSTHSVFHAQLISNGNNHGVQAFICQIRDLDSHQPLKGIEVGDIGPKFGYNQKDNGYMYFKNFKIPRTALLSRYSQIDKDGNFSIVGEPKVAYASMMFIRTYLIHLGAIYPAAGLLIAIRYSILRKQFKTLEEGKYERQIIDYQSQQANLTPILAFTFGAFFTKNRCVSMYFEMIDKVQKKNDFKRLKELHFFACCLKAYYTDRTLEYLKVIRECCGAHGYSVYSGLPNLIECVSPNVTLEGDNIVMYQQTAAHLIKSCAKIIQGAQLKGDMKYLNDIIDFDSK